MKRSHESARRWALGLCAGLMIASGCRQILGVEDPVPCESSAECALEGEPCVAAECIDGACTYSKIAAGSPAATDVPGDCAQSVCDDKGKATTTVDADDAPADDDAGDCKAPACDAEGAVTTAPAETDFAADTTPGDCEKPGCDADGNPVDVEDLDDCSCEVGTMVDCYDGPAGTLDQGLCAAGLAECLPGGELAECVGQVLPKPDSCLMGVGDADCTGGPTACTGDPIWSWGFGGPTYDFSGQVAVVPSASETAADTITVVNFDNQVTINGQDLTGDGRNAALVEIDGAGEPTVIGQLAVHVAGVRRNGGALLVGGTLQDEQDALFGLETITPAADDGFVAFYNSAMELVWVQTISSSANDKVIGIHPRLNGGVLAYGIMRGATAFDRFTPANTLPLVGSTGLNYFVVAYDDNGVVDWVTRWGSSTTPAAIDGLSSVVVAPEGVFVCGYSDSNLSVVHGTNTTANLHSNSSGSADAWVFRLGPTDGAAQVGNIVKIVSPGPDTCDSVAVLPDGGRVIAGSISGDVAYPNGHTLQHDGLTSVPDPFVMTTDAGGEPQQSISFDMSENTARVLSVDAGSDGGIIAGGFYSQGTINIAGEDYKAPANRTEAFVVRFGESLEEPPQWLVLLNKAGTDVSVQSVFQGSDLGVIVGGTMNNGTFDAGLGELDYAAQQDVFYAKFAQ